MSTLGRLLGAAWSAVLFEVALYRALARWVVRRPDVPRGATPIGHGRLVVPLLWLWIFGSAVEVVAVEVVLANIDAAWAGAVRLPMLVLGIWGVVWMLGMLACFRVRPHVLAATDLRLRGGARSELTVPLAAIASHRLVEHEVPGMIRSLHVEDGLALMGTGSRTNVELLLTGPAELETSAGPVTVSRVGFWADEPRELVALLRREPAPKGSPAR